MESISLRLQIDEDDRKSHLKILLLLSGAEIYGESQD